MQINELIQLSSLPTLEAKLILAKIKNYSREKIIASYDNPVSAKEKRQFTKLEKKRLKLYPLAYILGYKGFYQLNLVINNKVLIPRPETELLVELGAELILESNTPWTLIDVGTGSGAISLALAKLLETKNRAVYQTTKFIALDKSSSALKIAKLNSQRFHLEEKITLIKANLLKHKLIKQIDNSSPVLILANLPYLTKVQLKHPSLRFEPRKALYSPQAGLSHYQKLLKQIKALALTNFIVFMEINPEQEKEINHLVRKLLGARIKAIESMTDFRDQVRFIKVSSI